MLAQVSTVNVSLTIVPPTPLELTNALLVLGLGLLLGFLIASWAGSAGSPGAA